MYTNKEIQDMFQVDVITEKSKEVTKQSIDMFASIANTVAIYFDGMTDHKFTTYTEHYKKGVNQIANASEKFIDGFVVPKVYGMGTKD